MPLSSPGAHGGAGAPPRPLVLLHGLGQSPIAWQDFVSALGARPMQAPWMRGLKPTDPVGFDLGLAAESVANDLELQGLTSVDLLGVSVGASVALRLAVSRPTLVGRLVLAGPVLRPSAAALRVQKLALRLLPESRLVDAGVSRARMLAVYDSLREFDGAEALESVLARTLAVAGSRDKAGAAAARLVAARVPGARFEVVGGGGSLLNVGRPRELADLVRPFLDGD